MRRMRAVGGLVPHGLAIAVVRDHQHRASDLLERRDHPAKPVVHRLAGGNRRLEHAGVSHHVRVGEVGHDQVVFTALDGGDEPVRDLGLGHLGLQVVGRHLGRLRHEAVLALLGLFLAAVEEEGHVRVFLGLGQAELPQLVLGHPLADGVDDDALGIGGGHVGIVGVGILDHPQQRRQLGLVTLEAVETGLADGLEDLAGAVGAEVHAEEAVTGLQPLVAVDHRGRDELVGLVLGVALAHRGHRVGGALALAEDHRVIGLLDPLPAVVAVHGVVATDDGAYAGTLGQAFVKILHRRASLNHFTAW